MHTLIWCSNIKCPYLSTQLFIFFPHAPSNIVLSFLLCAFYFVLSFSITWSFWLSFNSRPLFTGGWRHGHCASGCPGKELNRKRQDLHWNQQQAGETRQRFVYPLSSCCYLHTCGFVSHTAFVLFSTKPPKCFVLINSMISCYQRIINFLDIYVLNLSRK